MTKTAAILISRQGRHPCRTTPWIVQLEKAIHWLQNNPHHVYTSLGQQTWELQIFFAQKKNIDQTIVIPENDKAQFEKIRQIAITQFSLDTSRVQFEKIYPEGSKSLLYQRDAQIISNSDLLIPISLRKKGHMETLIHSAPAKKRLINDFQINYCPEKARIAYKIDKNLLTKEVLGLKSQYIIHWTRGSNGPWPTEKKIDYYQAITNSDSYPRNAFAGIENMFTRGYIKASSRHMPQKTPTVSFSILPPHEAVSLMYWRARYCQMSFEPYGIGIDKDYAISMGIQPVQYFQPKNKPKNIVPWRCQSAGKRSDWQQEHEYRYLGDLDLALVPNEKLICFCYRQNEARDIQKRFGVQCIAMLSSNGHGVF